MRTRNTAAAQHMRLDYVQSVTKMGNYTNTCTCACTACGGVYVCETCPRQQARRRTRGAQAAHRTHICKSAHAHTHCLLCVRLQLRFGRGVHASLYMLALMSTAHGPSERRLMLAHVDCSSGPSEAEGGGRRWSEILEGGGGRREAEGGGRWRGERGGFVVAAASRSSCRPAIVGGVIFLGESALAHRRVLR